MTRRRDPALNGRHVLIVEDELVVALMLEDSVRQSGAEIMGPAADGASASTEDIRQLLRKLF